MTEHTLTSNTVWPLSVHQKERKDPVVTGVPSSGCLMLDDSCLLLIGGHQKSQFL